MDGLRTGTRSERNLDATIGIIANPMSGRDIRRLVARASVFPNAEKANMVLRLAGAAAGIGVGRVLVSTDTMGISAEVLRASQRRTSRQPIAWPELEFCELDCSTGTADDTRELVSRMRARGARVIVLLGGDGTARAAAQACADTPILPLSTGTNNAFPHVWEATVAGSAAALVATGAVDLPTATAVAKVLQVDCGARREVALVDVCVSTEAFVGARALWHVETLRELYCTFAEPHAIGLSSVAGLLRPTPRDHPGGVAIRLSGGAPAPIEVLAPLAPGVVATVGVLEVTELSLGERRQSQVAAGTVAVDGEREIEFGPADAVTVTLSPDGPRVVDVATVLRVAAELRLLVRHVSPSAVADAATSAVRTLSS